MGSGTSLLSNEDSAVLTQILKEEYDKLVAEGYKEHDIQLKLTSKYNEIVASIVTEPNGALDEVRGTCSEDSDGTKKSRMRRTLHGTTVYLLMNIIILVSDVFR